MNPSDLGKTRVRFCKLHRKCHPGLVPGIHLSLCSGACRCLDPGNERRDDNVGSDMSVAEQPRKPRAFDPHDPSIVEEPSAPAEPEAVVGEAAAPLADEKGTSRPTLADLGQRGLRWGALLFSALAGAAALGAAAWFDSRSSAACATNASAISSLYR